MLAVVTVHSRRRMRPHGTVWLVFGVVYSYSESAHHCDGLGRRPLNPSRTTGSRAFRFLKRVWGFGVVDEEVFEGFVVLAVSCVVGIDGT